MPKEVRWRKGGTIGSGDVIREHTGVTYDVGGLRTGETVRILPHDSSTLSGDAAAYGHDLLDRLISWTSPHTDPDVSSRLTAAFTLDDGGNISNESVTKVGGGAVRSITSAYTLGRLTQQETQTTLPAASTEIETYAYDGQGQETQRSLDPDAGGSDPAAPTRDSSYDALGHTSKANDRTPTDRDVTYVYDTADRLLTRSDPSAPSSDPSETLHFYLGMSGTLVEETTASGGTIARYVVSSDGEPVAQHRFSLTNHVPSGNGEWRWILSDTDGNAATYVRDDAGVAEQSAWDPYGRPQKGGSGSATPDEKPTLGFQGAQTDHVTGALVLGPRQYDPKTARFTTADTFVAGGLDLAVGTDELTGNRYLFAGANPVALFEDGHWPWSKNDTYNQYRVTITAAAQEFGISPVLLGAVIQHEGNQRQRGTRLPLGLGLLFRSAEYWAPGDTVGIAQMRPDLAQRLLGDYWGVHVPSERAVRGLLVTDDRLAIRLAAAYLRELKKTYKLTNKQAFIAYAFSEEGIRRLQAGDLSQGMRDRASVFRALRREIRDAWGVNSRSTMRTSWGSGWSRRGGWGWRGR